MSNVKSQGQIVQKSIVYSMFPPQGTGHPLIKLITPVVFAMQVLLVMLKMATAM